MQSLLEYIRRFNFVKLDLRGELPEEEDKGLIPFFGGDRKLTFAEIERVLVSIERSSAIAGVMVSISELRIGLPRANSLRRRLISLRRSGKKVLVYLESGGNVEYLIASGGEGIYMPPWSMLNLIGLGAEVTFLKDLLDRLGVSARMKGYGEYKSAAETFTRSSISGAHREMVDSILGSLRTQLESCISEGRGAKIADVRAVIDRGPFIASSAVAEGLIDGTAYESEMEERAGEMAGVKVKSLEARQLNRILSFRDSLHSAVGKVRRGAGIIAVVADSGFIALGDGTGRGPLKTMGSGSVLALLDRVSRDRAVKGLVFRILTPGGSGVASDLIRRRLKEISGKMPVVVSMSDVSASGGYLIALGADKIVADPMTLTGSIGIVSGKFELGELYRKIGVNKELVPTGKRSLMFSPSRDFSADEEEKLDELMSFYYREFVRTVAEGRGIGEARADEAAKGRVWTGAQAKDLGLVDELGGFWEAVNVARREAGLAEDKPPVLKFYTPARGLRLAALFGGSEYSGILKVLAENAPVPGMHGCFTVMPFRINVK